MTKQEIKDKIIEIVVAVYEHGQKTPFQDQDLPQGQLTIRDAVSQLNAIIEGQEVKEIERCNCDDSCNTDPRTIFVCPCPCHHYEQEE